ncbi:hypothetical protein CCACVL1_25371 [Corchorus capsularis]|uniref:Uncharacterized protein n=1 Tax=Corchorus capsularis TaxID=210143 RepID=A0A1R3GL38_COCAP|nr:hypothetical protein CCACVL1_25371 [Corchorus capsularis]
MSDQGTVELSQHLSWQRVVQEWNN